MAVERPADVAIVGAGMAGLTAAVTALERGRSVVVLEKGPRAGGSLYLSGGTVWTYASFDDVRSDIPHGDPDIQRAVIESLRDELSWLQELGIEVTDTDIPPFNDGTPRIGGKIHPESFTETMTSLIHDLGGRLFLETPMIGLDTDDFGGIDAVRAGTTDEDQVVVRAESIILATGGFQGNEELLERYVTEHTEHLWLRSNPWSTGDGFLAARSVGAKTTGGLGTFYGHNLAAPPADFSLQELLDVSQKYGHHAVAVDRTGKRFTDESVSHYGEVLAQDTAKRTRGEAYYILDADLYDSHTQDGSHIGTMVENADSAGGRVARASSLEGLADRLMEWGVDGSSAIQTVNQFNQAVATETTVKLDPPRRQNRESISKPPFYAVAVQPGITHTMGGLAIDQDARVLHRARSGSGISLSSGSEHQYEPAVVPIDGLFAAGSDVGGVNYRRYLGGLATALVTGRIAGKNAANLSI